MLYSETMIAQYQIKRQYSKRVRQFLGNHVREFQTFDWSIASQISVYNGMSDYATRAIRRMLKLNIVKSVQF